MKNSSFLLVLGVCTCFTQQSVAQEYIVSEIVDGFPVSRTESESINDKGTVVGFSNAFQAGNSVPFFSLDGGFESTGVVPGDVAGVAYDINEKDQIAGETTVNGTTRRAFIYLPSPDYGLDAGIHNLGTLGGNSASARAINDKGQVVGSSKNADGRTYAFIWLPEPDYGMGAGMHQIDSFGFEGFGTRSSALGMNNKGQVSGYARDKSGDNQGLLWFPEPDYGMSSGLHNLGTLGGTSTLLWDINESGQTAGYSKNSSDDIHAVLWLPTPAFGLPAQVLNDLDTLGGRDAAFLGINDSGQMVGWSQLSNGDYVGMLYRNGEMIDLNDLASDPALLYIDEASEINNHGSISCYGVSTPEIRSRGLRLDLKAMECAADLDGNGELNFFDVAEFLEAYAAMDPAADFTGDGAFNFFDVAEFLEAYANGCP